MNTEFNPELKVTHTPENPLKTSSDKKKGRSKENIPPVVVEKLSGGPKEGKPPALGRVMEKSFSTDKSLGKVLSISQQRIPTPSIPEEIGLESFLAVSSGMLAASLYESESSTAESAEKESIVHGYSNCMVDVADQVKKYQMERVPINKTEASKIEVALGNAKEFLGESAIENLTEVKIVDSEEITFGMGLVETEEEGIQLIIEKPFLEKIEELGNPYDMLSRAMVYTLSKGSHEEKKIAEYEYAQNKFDGLSAELAEGRGGTDVEKLLTNFSEGLITYSDGKDTEMGMKIKERLKQSLFEIGTNMMNRPASSSAKGRRIIANVHDPEFDKEDLEDGAEDVNVAILAITADPEHWGHTETALRAMARMDIDQVLVVVQGFDKRKPRSKLTEKERHELTQMRMKEFDGLLLYSDWEKGNEKIGEESFQEMIKINKDRPGK